MLPRLLLIAAILFVQICCMPPLEAEVMVCPITGEQCEPAPECDPDPPVVLSTADAPVLIAPQVETIDVAAPRIVEHHQENVLTFWSAPTRTTVLRI